MGFSITISWGLLLLIIVVVILIKALSGGDKEPDSASSEFSSSQPRLQNWGEGEVSPRTRQVVLAPPLQVLGTALVSENQKTFVEVRLQNNSDQDVVALWMKAWAYDEFGNALDINGNNNFMLYVQNWQLKKGTKGKTPPLLLPDATIRQIEVAINSFQLDNGTIVEIKAMHA